MLSYLEEINWISKNRIMAGKHTDIEISLAGEPLKQYKEFLVSRKAKLKKEA
jgi:hypothetical protein